MNACNEYNELNEVQDAENADIPTRKVKQRSPFWFERRKDMKVTGSTMFQAIGLDGLKRQKEHFDSVVCGVQNPRSESVENALEYGKKNEINASATFVGKVMPLLFPGKYFCEEGFIEKNHSDGNPFMIISPDGSVRAGLDEISTIAGVEFKCPLNELHAKMPTRYLLQCLSEIEALEVDTLLYLCWRPDLSSLFKVKRNTILFNEAFQLAQNLYDKGIPKRLTKLTDEIKQLKAAVENACMNEETVEFIGVIPSLSHDANSQNNYKADTPKIIIRQICVLHVD